jgi:hypothetical protein
MPVRTVATALEEVQRLPDEGGLRIRQVRDKSLMNADRPRLELP